MSAGSGVAVERCTAKVGDAELSWLEAGARDAEPVVLVHGIPAGAELWRGVMGRMAEQGFRCLAPDLPGYGATRVPDAGDRSLDGAAALLGNWIAQLELGPLWLVAHDIGGGVAQVMATRRTEQFNRLTLSNCIVDDSWPIPAIRLTIATARMGLFRPMAAAGLFPNPYANHELRRSVARPECLDPETVGRVFWDSKISDPRGRLEFQRHLAALDPQQTVRIVPHLRALDIPVHLVWGMRDPNQPWAGPGRRLTEILPEATVRQLPDAGHFLQLDSPDDYLEAVLARGA